MPLDSTLTAGLIGAGVMFLSGAMPFFIGWGSLQANLDALKTRIGAVEEELASIHKLRDDVSYIRGLFDGGKST